MCRGQVIEGADLHPATAHLVTWFNDLTDSRTYTIIAGMGGGSIIPNPISWQELQVWQSLSRNNPTPWELDALRKMDAAWRAAYDKKQGSGCKGQATKQHQGIGDYCNGADVEKCRKNFGKGLERVCATCPD